MKTKKMKTFENPILPGFYPDPSICRVNDDYYLVTSSFAYFPGVPIFHSKDLVHWKQIGHVLDRTSQLDLDSSGISAGIFAPTIRFWEGTFYVITTNRKNGGNFIVSTKNPSRPWSEPFWIEDADGIDPSLFFDEDGRVYYIGTTEATKVTYFGESVIWCQELDLNTMKLIGERHNLWQGALVNAQWAEGPHIYKVKGYYYLMISEGGTGYHHAVTIARSETIFGIYKGNPSNPILTHRHLGENYPISNPGHADLVETQNGEWWMVALASRPYGGYYRNLGRETFLIPVIWENGWPIVSPGTGKVENSYQIPDLQENLVLNIEAQDDFDTNILSCVWNTIRTPRDIFYSLDERPGYLRIKLSPISMMEELKSPNFEAKYQRRKEVYLHDSPSFLGRRQQHFNFSVEVKMEFKPSSEFEAAGLALIQNNNFQYRFEYILEDGNKKIRLIKGSSITKVDYEHKTFYYNNQETNIADVIFDCDIIYLRIIASDQLLYFFYGASMSEMKLLKGNVDGRHLSPDVAGGYVGTYIGMFASSNGKKSENVADFDWFRYSIH